MSGKKNKKRPISEINVVPYIDVMLVLLVVFMVTAPLLMQGVEVSLPQARSSPMDNKDLEPIIISLKADGTFYINIGGNEKAQKTLAQIKAVVEKVMRQKPETPVLVWGDGKVPYAEVVSLMSEMQRAGAPSVGLVTEPPR